MRNQNELRAPEFDDNMAPLVQELVGEGIEHVWRVHPAAQAEPTVKQLIGYWPSGENQIIIKMNGRTYSIVKGMLSWGDYEIWRIAGRKGGLFYKNPRRYKNPKSLINDLRKDR